MEKSLKILDEAFGMLSAISVKGVDVEIMATVRIKLRQVYNELKSREKEESDG